MSSQPIQLKVSQSSGSADERSSPLYKGPAFFSYGFRPFFLSAALFAGVAVPAWVLIVAGAIGSNFLYPAREWHVHEMLFGFLPAVIAGFILTAIPNWSGRAPVRGTLLISLWVLWLAGRLMVALPGPAPVLAATIDAAFLVSLAAVIWREIAAARMWNRSAIGGLITLYAGTNILFHVMALRGASTDVSERVALSVLFVLLTFIGGRVTPSFTTEYLAEQQIPMRPAVFSRFDALSMLLVVLAALVWIVQPDAQLAGVVFAVAGVSSMIRVSRWQGWLAWREPLVLILSVGYAWVALSLLALGAASLGFLPAANAVHVLTTGAVGAMTLAVMTRASLGHTGRPRHAGLMTVVIYIMVNVGAVLRVLTPGSDAQTGLTNLMLGMAALAWSGAYLLFALVYGPILVRSNLEE